MGRPYAFLSFIWALVMFIWASRPVPPEWCTLFPHEDKVWHLLEFALLAMLVYKSFAHSSEAHIAARAAARTLMIVLPYAAALELYQWFIPFRDCSFFDLLANCAGAAAAILLVRGSHG